MKDLLALCKLLVSSATYANGTLTFNIDLNVTGMIDIKDPDGNWIEISQRKSITGSLD